MENEEFKASVEEFKRKLNELGEDLKRKFEMEEHDEYICDEYAGARLYLKSGKNIFVERTLLEMIKEAFGEIGDY